MPKMHYLHCLPALAMILSMDIAEAFWILADFIPEHEKNARAPIVF